MKPDREVNNDIYRRLGHAWWDDDVGELGTLRFWINPVRFGHVKRVIDAEQELGRRLDFQESDHLGASYMGYAARKAG